MTDSAAFVSMMSKIDFANVKFKWGRKKDIIPYVDKDPFKNIILSDSERISMQSQNVAAIGMSGPGNIFRFVKPNLYQLQGSYVVLDTNGDLLRDTGALFDKKGYNIYVLDLMTMQHTLHYNPLAYVKEDEKDIVDMAKMLLNCHLSRDDERLEEPAVLKANAIRWLAATIAYLQYEVRVQDRNIPKLMELLNAELQDLREGRECTIDQMCDKLAQKTPDHLVVNLRRSYKSAMIDISTEIMVLDWLKSYFSLLNDNPTVADLLAYDELKLDTYRNTDQKSILFIMVSDRDKTYNAIATLLLTQMITLLCRKEDDRRNLNTPVQFILDGITNIKEIPGLDMFAETMRRYSMSLLITMEYKSQFDLMYKDTADIILNSCQAVVYMDGEDIFPNYTPRTRDKCFVAIRNLPPFLSVKYDVTKHPYYRETADYDEKKVFDIEEYLRRREEK